jgi:hypothetical protein
MNEVIFKTSTLYSLLRENTWDGYRYIISEYQKTATVSNRLPLSIRIFGIRWDKN